MIWLESLGCTCCALLWMIIPAPDGGGVAVLSALITPEEAPALAASLALELAGPVDVLPDLDELEAGLDRLDSSIATLREAAAT